MVKRRDLKSKNGEDEMAQILLITVSGILIVFMTLVLLVLIFTVFGKLVSGGSKKAPASAPAPEQKVKASAKPAAKPAAAPAPAVEEGIPGAVIAAIAAAVSMMGEQDGKNYRISSVRRERAGGRPVWALAGIMENTRPF